MRSSLVEHAATHPALAAAWAGLDAPRAIADGEQAVERTPEQLEVLREAGDRAYALNAFGAASGFYAEAIDLWPDARAGRGELLFRYARSLFLWNSADVVGVLEEAVELLLDAGSSDIAAEAEVTLGLVHWFNSERKQAAPHFAKATELIESAEPLSSPSGACPTSPSSPIPPLAA